MIWIPLDWDKESSLHILKVESRQSNRNFYRKNINSIICSFNISVKLLERNTTQHQGFIKYKENNTRCVTCDTLYMTRDMCHVTHDWWVEGNLLSKFQLPSSYGLGVKVFWKYFLKRSLTTTANTHSYNFLTYAGEEIMLHFIICKISWFICRLNCVGLGIHGLQKFKIFF